VKTCIIDTEGRCWCGQQWDGQQMRHAPLAAAAPTLPALPADDPSSQRQQPGGASDDHRISEAQREGAGTGCPAAMGASMRAMTRALLAEKGSNSGYAIFNCGCLRKSGRNHRVTSVEWSM
jgi:hypothetical protein